MKREHAMALFGLFKMKAESAAATWFIVTHFLGMYKILLWEKNKTEVIWSIVHEAECRRKFLIDMDNNNLDALKLFYRAQRIQELVESKLFEIFYAKEVPPAEEAEGKAAEMQDS